MPQATAHFESDANRQGGCRDAMTIWTTEAIREIYPEAEITATDHTDRRAACHSKNIPESRPAMISGFPIPVLATARPKREYPGSMQSQADVDGSGFPRFDQRRQLAALRAGRISSRAQATIHAGADHERKSANRAMDRITMPAALLARRLRSSLWCQKQVVIGHRRRSARI